MHLYHTPTHITAFSTTREGDVSIDIPRLFMPHHQVHETNTVIIDEAFLEKNALEQTLAMDGVDALTTNIPNVCVCVKTADCIPVLLWDEISNVVSAVHAGWKGTLERIVEANIEVMKDTFGVKPENLQAIIGPGIGPESFEVGDEVYQLFAEAGFPMEDLAKTYPLLPESPLRKGVKTAHLADSDRYEHKAWHIDLWECNRGQLIAKGVKAENILVSGIDTYTEYKHFYSARRKLNGRIINGIMRRV